jgi:hypothetical protein
MLHALWSVLVDLWKFLWGRQLPVNSYMLETGVSSLSLQGRPSQSLIASPVAPFAIAVPKNVTEQEQSALPLVDVPETARALAQSGTIYFVSTQSGARLLHNASMQYDNGLLCLRFGQAVSLKQFVGQYAEVLVFGLTGFVRKEDITPYVATVWPVFVPNTVYEYDALATQLVRTHLNDEFLAGALLLPLQPGEYVSIRLLRDQLVFPWPKVRPRVVGTWHTLLRGVVGVHSGVVPVSDSVMEWVAEDSVGRLAYVDAVLPDDTLKISAVGLVVEGEYTESVVPSAVWREWRPVFISLR